MSNTNLTNTTKPLNVSSESCMSTTSQKTQSNESASNAATSSLIFTSSLVDNCSSSSAESLTFHALERKTSSFSFINDTLKTSCENFIRHTCTYQLPIPLPIVDDYTQPTSEGEDDSDSNLRRPLETIYEDEPLLLPPRKPGRIRLNSLCQHSSPYALECAPVSYSAQERQFRKTKK